MKQQVLCLFHGLLIALSVFGQSSAQQRTAIKPPVPNTYALIVGVSQYQYPDQYKPLEYADRDGREFYNYLVKSNRTAIKSENIDTIFNEQATSSAILLKLIEFKEKLKEGDLFYFYFSGHGDAIDSELAYLLAYDAPPGRGGKEKNHYLIGSGVLEIYKIKQIFRRITEKNVRIVFISDACRTNELAGGEEGKQSFYRKVMDEDAVEIRFTSCSANQKSYEGPQWGGGRGLFSYHFINGLVGLADSDNDGKVTVKEIDRYVTDNVESDSRDQEYQLPQQSPELGCALQYCDYQVLNYVDPAQKTMLLQRLEQTEQESSLLAAKGKGVDLHAIIHGTSNQERYAEFISLMKKGSLTGPNSAYSVYQVMINDPGTTDLVKSELRKLLCTHLNNSANAVIYAYLDGSRKYRDYSKAYFLKAYEELKLYTELSELYEYNKKQIDANLLFLKGHSYFESEKTSDLRTGLAMIDSAIALNPSAAYLYNIRGRYLYFLNQYRECLDALQKAIELAPSWVAPLTNKGTVYSFLGDFDSSLFYVKRSLALDTNYISTYKSLSTVYWLAGKPDSALFLLNKAIEKDPLDPELYYQKADLLYVSGNQNEALELYHQSIEMDSTTLEAYQGALRFHIENGMNLDSLSFYMTHMLTCDTSGISAFRYIAQLLCEFKEYEMAKTYYKSAYNLDPQNTQTIIGFGDVYNAMDQIDTAFLFYNYARMLDSNYAIIYNRLGNYFYRVNDVSSAISNYRKANEIDPWNSQYTSSLGMLYMDVADYRTARHYLEKHLDQFRIESDVYLRLVRCCAAMNEIDAALQYLEKGIELFPQTFDQARMRKDPLLKDLRKNQRYRAIMKRKDMK
ncbi:MAG: tetratricopeptide repeat protein [Bacteroidota bacterium]